MDEPVAVLALKAAIQNGPVLLSPRPPQAGYWCSRSVRRPDVRLIRLGSRAVSYDRAQTLDSMNKETDNVTITPGFLTRTSPCEDRDGAGPLLQASLRPFPFIRKVVADAGYQDPRR